MTSQMSATIRTMTEADRPAVEIVRRQAIEDAYSDRYDRSLVAEQVAAPESALSIWGTAERSIALVAETAVTIVSYGVLDAQNRELLALYTVPDYQNRGYATEILRALMARARKAGCSCVIVWAPEPSVAFFTHCGFEPTGNKRTESGIPYHELKRSLEDVDFD